MLTSIVYRDYSLLVYVVINREFPMYREEDWGFGAAA